MKEMVLAHFEKAILAVCAGVAIWFLVDAIGIKRYEKTPEDFSSITQKANSNVQNSKPQVDDVVGADYVTETKKEMAPIPSAAEFKHERLWVRPFDFGAYFRGQPKILKPGKTWVMSNRGMMEMFAFDQDGKPRKEKLPKSKAKAGAIKGPPQMGMGGGGGGMGDRRQKAMEMYKKQMSKGNGDGDYRKMMAAGGGGDGGNEHYKKGGGGYPGAGDLGVGMMGGMGGDMSGGTGEQQPQPGADGVPPPAAAEAKRGRPNNFTRKDLVKQADDKGKKVEDTEIEVYVQRRVGLRWVEVVAAFPHQDQIIEYTKALKEGARNTKLRYAMSEIERRELKSDMSWSEWHPIDLLQQYFLINNAIAYVPETSPVVLPGLAMYVPQLVTAMNPHLHDNIADFDPTKQEVAVYQPEHLDPFFAKRLAQQMKPVNRNPHFPPEVKKEKEAEIRKQYLASGAGNKENLGFIDASKDKSGAKGNNRSEVKTAMVRFWDFTVDPGRRYQYRIRVRTFNPNYEREDVADPEFARPKLLTGDWSEPTDEIYVDNDTTWYVADNKKSMKPDVAAVEVHHWYLGMGEWLVNRFVQRPGDILGLTAQAEPISILKWNDVEHTWEAKKETLRDEFDSNSILLSADGGTTEASWEDRNFKFRLPREVVAVDDHGDLVRRLEAADENDPARKLIADQYEELIKKYGGDSSAKKDGDAGMGEDPAKGGGKPKKPSGKAKAPGAPA